MLPVQAAVQAVMYQEHEGEDGQERERQRKQNGPGARGFRVNGLVIGVFENEAHTI